MGRELAANNKVVKYAGLSSQGEFVPIVVDFHGPINMDAIQFFSELGWQLVETTGDVGASSFSFQRISVATVQRFNSFLLHDSFVGYDRLQPKSLYFFFLQIYATRAFPLVKQK